MMYFEEFDCTMDYMDAKTFYASNAEILCTAMAEDGELYDIVVDKETGIVYYSTI